MSGEARDLFGREAANDAVWREVDKGNRRLVELADRHYTRQTPGSNQALRPGCNYCLLLSDGLATWVAWRPIPEVGRQDGLEAWECSLFRRDKRCFAAGQRPRARGHGVDVPEMGMAAQGWIHYLDWYRGDGARTVEEIAAREVLHRGRVGAVDAPNEYRVGVAEGTAPDKDAAEAMTERQAKRESERCRRAVANGSPVSFWEDRIVAALSELDRAAFVLRQRLHALRASRAAKCACGRYDAAPHAGICWLCHAAGPQPAKEPTDAE